MAARRLDRRGARRNHHRHVDASRARGELEQYAGHPLANDAALAEAALQIVRSGRASHVAITLGYLSALLVSAEGEMRLSAIEVEVHSAVGAVGSFLGAATYGLAAGQSIKEAFRLGLAAGTAAVMSPGTGLCQPADVERLLGEIRP